MKKLILILTILIGLNSCTSYVNNKNPHETKEYIYSIQSIQYQKDGFCIYKTQKHSNVYSIVDFVGIELIDTCGKYNIGDTIVFQKKINIKDNRKSVDYIEKRSNSKCIYVHWNKDHSIDSLLDYCDKYREGDKILFRKL